VKVGKFSQNDIVVQISRCTFDIHVDDIVGALIIGATLVMLRPEGNIDWQYLSTLLKEKNITYMHSVPTYLNNFFLFLKNTNSESNAFLLRSLCSSGE